MGRLPTVALLEGAGLFLPAMHGWREWRCWSGEDLADAACHLSKRHRLLPAAHHASGGGGGGGASLTADVPSGGGGFRGACLQATFHARRLISRAGAGVIAVAMLGEMMVGTRLGSRCWGLRWRKMGAYGDGDSGVREATPTRRKTRKGRAPLGEEADG